MSVRQVLLVALFAAACTGSGGEESTTSTAVSTTLATTSTSAADESSTTSTSAETTDTTEAEAPETSITVAVDAIRAVALAEVIPAFTEATGVAVTLDVRDFADLESASSDESVDVYMGPHLWLDRARVDGLVAPLVGFDQSLFISVASEALARDGMLYGVPFSAESLALYVNHDVFGPDVPTDLVADCPAEVSVCFVMPGLGEGGGYHMTPFLMAGTAQGLVERVRDAASMADGMAAFAALADSPVHVQTSIANARAAFIDGAALFLGGPWDLGPIEDAGMNFSVIPIPQIDGTTPRPGVSVLAFYRRAGSSNVDAAESFLAWMATAEAQRSLWLRDRRAPVHVGLDDVGPVAAGFRAAVERGFALPSTDLEVYWEELGAAAGDIYAGADPVDAVLAAAERIDDRLP